MIGSYNDQRACYTIGGECYIKRWCGFVYQFYDERNVFWEHILYKSSQRHCYCYLGLEYDERTIAVPPRTIQGVSSITCFTPAAIANDSIRYCTYVPGAQVILFSLETTSSIVYRTERSCYACQTQISQRFIGVLFTTSSEVVCQVVRYQENKVHSPSTSFSIRVATERTLYWEDNIPTQRWIILSYRTQSEKVCTYVTNQQSLLHTPAVETTLLNYASERIIEVVTMSTISERYVFFLTSPYVERYIALRYAVISERYVATSISRVWRLDEFIVTPSRLEVTERWTFCTPFAYLDERFCFGETRPLYEVRTPLSSTSKVTVRDNKDAHSSMSISSDRQFEYHGLDGKIEQLSDVMMSKVVMQTPRNDLQISAVDNTGAAVNTAGITKKKNLLYSLTLQINIIK